MQIKALDSDVAISESTQISKPPIIAHIIFRLAVGGLENGVVNIINRIPETQYRHVIISLTDATDFKDRINRKDVDIYCLHKKPGRDVSYLFRFWKILKQVKPDIVHTRNLAALETTVVSALMGVKYRIHSEHGWGVKDENVKSDMKYLLYRRIMSKLVHRYIGLSKNIEDTLIKNIKVPKRKVRQVYNGVDCEKFISKQSINERENELFPKGFITKDCVLIGTVGRMDPVKDQRLLLLAFIKLLECQNNLKNMKLVMIGDGAMMPELKKIVSDKKVENNVWLAGSKNNIHKYMQYMDIFCLPSKNEGISNTILEAMASNLPVVATNVGGNGELIINDTTGKLVPAEDCDALKEALHEYVNDSSLRKAHGLMARKRVLENFSLDSMVKNYLSIYNGI